MPEYLESVKREFTEGYENSEAELFNIIESFSEVGETLHQKRNTIKKLSFRERYIAIKSFRIPSGLQAVAYRFFRKCKAQRAYENSHKLITLGLLTPEPIAYIEKRKNKWLQESFYICLFHESTVSAAEEFQRYNGSKRSREFIEAFTHFTFELHENNVLHIDHNSNNTLISETPTGYEFSIIDINRMRFMPLNIKQRLNNFVRLTDNIDILNIIADTYADKAKLDRTTTRQLLHKLKLQHLNRIKCKKLLKTIFKTDG